MSNYKQVQFISWELHTGPFIGQPQQPGVGWYAGLHDTVADRRTDVLGQCRDIDARLAFVADALDKAHALSRSDADTLKIFMAPEFVFRGAGGAYLHDLVNGWEGGAPAEFLLPAPYDGRWGGLFGGLRALAAGSRFEDWLFVFGTAVSASFPTARQDGKYLLDPRRIAEIYNTALIQRGGPAHGAHGYATRKHYKSPIDFLTWNLEAAQHIQSRVRPLDPEWVVPADVLGVLEGGAVFRIADINDGSGAAIDFGVEICLDHASSGGNRSNHFGRIRSAGQAVRIQLVPSAGMALVPESVRLQAAGGGVTGAYAFNCDGLATLDWHTGSHTQLWDNGVPTLRVEIDGGAPRAGTRLATVAAELPVGRERVPAAMLWNSGQGAAGAGQVRVFDPRAL